MPKYAGICQATKCRNADNNEVLRDDTSTVRLLGQEISARRKTLKIQHFEDLSNGFTPRLHLLKVGYPMNDKSTLRDDAGCFFITIWKKRY